MRPRPISRVAWLPDQRQTDAVEVLAKLGEMQRVLAAGGYDVRPLIATPPAIPRQVAELESAVGSRLPEAFRDVLLTVSSHVEFCWFAGDRK